VEDKREHRPTMWASTLSPDTAIPHLTRRGYESRWRCSFKYEELSGAMNCCIVPAAVGKVWKPYLKILS
jgi:hypothetical protein